MPYDRPDPKRGARRVYSQGTDDPMPSERAAEPDTQGLDGSVRETGDQTSRTRTHAPGEPDPGARARAGAPTDPDPDPGLDPDARTDEPGPGAGTVGGTDDADEDRPGGAGSAA